MLFPELHCDVRKTPFPQKAFLGECPICDRSMYNLSSSCDRHHFTPKSRGGKETHWVHRVCHTKIHSLWTEKELERTFNDPVLIRADPRIAEFIAWVRKKDPLYYDKSKRSSQKGKNFKNY